MLHKLISTFIIAAFTPFSHPLIAQDAGKTPTYTTCEGREYTIADLYDLQKRKRIKSLLVNRASGTGNKGKIGKLSIGEKVMVRAGQQGQNTYDPLNPQNGASFKRAYKPKYETKFHDAVVTVNDIVVLVLVTTITDRDGDIIRQTPEELQFPVNFQDKHHLVNESRTFVYHRKFEYRSPDLRKYFFEYLGSEKRGGKVIPTYRVLPWTQKDLDQYGASEAANRKNKKGKSKASVANNSREIREWTDKSVGGRFAGMTREWITIQEESGKRAKIKVAALNEADLNYIQEITGRKIR